MSFSCTCCKSLHKMTNHKLLDALERTNEELFKNEELPPRAQSTRYLNQFEGKLTPVMME